MSDNPDAIRQEIEETRARLGTNVDAVADKVTPANVVQRQTDKVTSTVKDAVSGVKEKIMGAADTATSTVQDKVTSATSTVQDKVSSGTGHTGNALHSTGDTLHGAKDNVSAKLSDAGTAISHAPAQVKAQAQGNPLAAGLIAFGAGMLISSLIPASQKEREAAQQLKTAAEPLAGKVTDAAKDVVQDLKEPAQEAMQSVKATAADAAQNVKNEGQSAVTDVKDRATDAKTNVQNT
jgi:gas vesicle protein